MRYRRAITGMLLLGLLLLLGGSAWGDTSPAATAPTPKTTVTPTKTVAFPVIKPMHDVYFGADGQTVYGVQMTYAIYLWPSLMDYWPEIGGGLVGLIVLILAWRMGRLWRYGRLAVGEPHCRHCGYRLHDETAAMCSECGGALGGRNVRWGKPIRWRMAAMSAVSVVLIGLYTTGLLFVDRWRAPWRFWFDWKSQTLANLVIEQQWRWPQRFIACDYTSVLAWDFAQEAEPHEVVRLPYIRGDRLTRMPDTPWGVVMNGEQTRARVFHMATFEVQPTEYAINFHSPSAEPISNLFPSDQGGTFCYVGRGGQLYRSPAITEGEPWADWEKVHQPLEGFPTPRNSSSVHWGMGPWAWMMDSEHILGLEPGRYRRRLFVWHLPDGKQVASFQLQTGVGDWIVSAQAEDSRRLYVATHDRATGQSQAVEVWDWRKGEHLANLHAPGGGPLGAIALSPNGRYLYAHEPQTPTQILVRDNQQGTWVGKLDIAPLIQVRSIQVDEVGRRVIVHGYDGRQTRVLSFETPRWADPVPEKPEGETVAATQSTAAAKDKPTP